MNPLTLARMHEPACSVTVPVHDPTWPFRRMAPVPELVSVSAPQVRRSVPHPSLTSWLFALVNFTVPAVKHRKQPLSVFTTLLVLQRQKWPCLVVVFLSVRQQVLSPAVWVTVPLLFSVRKHASSPLTLKPASLRTLTTSS